MSTIPAPPDLDRWPDRLAALLGADGLGPSDDGLQRAADLGRALAQARVPLQDVTTAPWAVLEEQVRRGALPAGAVIQALRPLVQQLLAGYTAGVQEDAAQHGPRDPAQTFLDITAVMLVALDTHGNTTLVNKKACTILGYDEQELTGKNWFEHFVPEHDRDRVKTTFAALLAGRIELAEYCENPVRTRAGHERLIAWHNALLRDEDGTITGTLSAGEDITERRQADEELRRHYEDLEQLVAQRAQELEKVNARLQEELSFTQRLVTGMPVIICRVTPDGTTRFVNPAGERITGYRAEELLGRSWRRTLYPGEQYCQVEGLLAAFRHGDVRDYEMVLTTKSGAKRTISWNSVNLSDADGQLVEIIGLGIDVTEHRQAEEVVRQSEQQLRLIMDNVPAMIVYFGADQRCRFANRRYDEWHNFPTGQSVGKHVRDLLGDVVYRAIRPRVNAVLAGEPVHYETEVTFGGTPRWVDATYVPDKDSAGHVIGFYALLTDVTERHRAEEVLRQSEQQLRLIMDNVPAMIVYTGPDQRCCFANRRFDEWHGFPTGHAVGKHVRDIVGEALFREIQPRLNAALAGQQVHFEIPVMVGATPRWVDVTCVPDQDSAGQVPGFYTLLTDITERKRAEQALRESTEFLDKIINSISDPIFVKDRQHRHVLINDAECALAGHRREEILGRTDYEFFPKAQVDVFWEKDEAVFETGEENVNEEEITDAQGRTRTLVTKKTLYTDPAGKKLIVGIVRDITDRKRAEEAMRVSEAKFRTLAETIPVAITITAGPRVLYVNSAAEAITGYTRQELLELKSYWDVVHPDFRDLVRDRGVERERGAQVPSRYEMKLLPRDTAERWVELSASLFEFDGLPATLATGIDITHRKRAEEAARVAQERLELALRGADLGLWDWDVPTGHVLYDERWAQMLGYAPGELEPSYRTWETHVHPDDLPRVRDILQAHLDGRTPFYEAEHRLQAKTGEWKWILARGQVVVRDEHGAPLRCTGTHLDLTDRKRTAEALRQHQEQLAHAARVSLVGEMVSGLAHEMAQPLSAMLYYARACSTRLAAGTWGIPEIRQTMEKIAAQAERAGKVIHRLKAFVRRAETERVSIDINALVRDVLDLCAPDTRANRVTIHLELADGLPPVHVDRVEIEQVLLNLIRNGFDAMARNPVDARKLVIRTYADTEARVGVVVEDTGPGVPAGLERQIFDPFFTTKPAGTGLGLPISRSILEAHDGSLWVATGSPHGATFGFSLPVARSASRKAR